MRTVHRDVLGLILLLVYALAWALLAIEPLSRSDWVLENLLVWATLPLLVAFRRRLAISNMSQVLLFVFYTLHAIGGHWSYSNVPMPWQEWGFERNHYDRIVHLSFGALLWLPLRDGLVALTGIARRLAGLFAISLTLSLSALYEIVEWGAVAIVAPDLGQAFLGAQGDEFDATKDMALALVGAILVFLVDAFVSRRHAVLPSRAPAPRPPLMASPASGPSRPAAPVAIKPGVPPRRP